MNETSKLINFIKGNMAEMLAQQPKSRCGIIQSFDPTTYSARVLVQPEGTLSGWLPILTQWVGNGWGFFAPPSPGDQVRLVPQEDSAQDYVMIGGMFSLVDQPLPAPSGEFWLVHQKGQFIKLLNDGSISSSGTWKHEGDFHATGAVMAGFGAGDQVGLQTHIHTQGNDSAGNKEVPTNAPTGGS